MPICLHVAYEGFHTTMEELNSCSQDFMACKA